MPTPRRKRQALIAHGGGGPTPPADQHFIALGFDNAAAFQVYAWDDATGFGTQVSDPASKPLTGATALKFSPNADFLSVHDNSPPYWSVYPFSAAGFGTLSAGPLAASYHAPAFDSDEEFYYAHSSGDPKANAWLWSPGAGFGTKFSDPSPSVPGASINGPGGLDRAGAISISYGNSGAFLFVYAMSAAGFGAQITSPASATQCLAVNDLCFTPANDAMAIGAFSTPFVQAWPWNGSSFGSKFSNPASLPAERGLSVDFNPTGDVLAVGNAAGGIGLNAYQFSSVSGFGTKYADPSAGNGSVQAMRFSPEGGAVVAGAGAGDYVYAYQWAAGFGTRISNPGTLPGALTTSIDFCTLSGA